MNLPCFRAVLWNVGSGCTLVTCVRLCDLSSGQFIHSLYVLFVLLLLLFFILFLLYIFLFIVLCVFLYFIITAALCVLDGWMDGWMDGMSDYRVKLLNYSQTDFVPLCRIWRTSCLKISAIFSAIMEGSQWPLITHNIKNIFESQNILQNTIYLKWIILQNI